MFVIWLVGIAGASDLTPCKSLLKISVKYLISLPVWCFLYCLIDRSFVRDRQDRHTGTDTYTRQPENGRHRECEAENSSLDSLLAELPQGKGFSFFPWCNTEALLMSQSSSLMHLNWHKCLPSHLLLYSVNWLGPIEKQSLIPTLLDLDRTVTVLPSSECIEEILCDFWV